MNTKKRIDRLSLMLSFRFMEALRDVMGNWLDDRLVERLWVETFEKARTEIERYERSIERHRIEPGTN